ncbi:MAG: hypothetical protein KGI54_07110 [Pseudomonadota bacterium]|nr:hypothetical protein [Pseudomonadota bacterium]
MVWAAIGAAAVTVVGGALMSGGSGGGGAGNSSAAAYDPYASYRPAAAQQLNALQANPGSAIDSGYGQALQQGASRAMASQGYTGSGNALVAAAQAGGTAYQQEFNNLVTLSGAGQSPANAMQASNAQANVQQQQSNQMWGQIGNLVGQGINAYNSPSGGTPATSMPSYDPNNGYGLGGGTYNNVTGTTNPAFSFGGP